MTWLLPPMNTKQVNGAMVRQELEVTKQGLAGWRGGLVAV